MDYAFEFYRYLYLKTYSMCRTHGLSSLTDSRLSFVIDFSLSEMSQYLKLNCKRKEFFAHRKLQFYKRENGKILSSIYLFI